MAAIPNYFFLNKILHQKIVVVRSDDSVVAWNYEEEKQKWYPRGLLRRNYKKAYTVNQAARLMNVKKAYLIELIKQGLVTRPSIAYDLGTYRPLQSYISEDDMLEYREAAWDKLPKNRFGIPTKDTMLSEAELIHVMAKGDDREFVIEGDEVIRIFKQ